MNEIRNYIEAMFSSLPNTKEVAEVKLNMLDHAEEKFNEISESGKAYHEAVGIVISGLGTLDELKKELELDDNLINTENPDPSLRANKEKYFEFKRKHGMVIAISVALFILSPISFVIVENLGFEIFAMVTFFILIAIGVGLLIYFGVLDSRYREELGLADDEKAKWKKDNKYDALSGILWVATVIVYLILGFFYGLWHPGWIVFLIATVFQIALDYYTKSKYADS